MNYVVDKVKGGVKRGCVHFDTPSLFSFLMRYYFVFFVPLTQKYYPIDGINLAHT